MAAGLWEHSTENALRLVAIGSKKGPFSSNQSDANKRINWYSLIEVAKANNVELHVYLKKVFNLLQQVKYIDDINALLPVHAKAWLLSRLGSNDQLAFQFATSLYLLKVSYMKFEMNAI